MGVRKKYIRKRPQRYRKDAKMFQTDMRLLLADYRAKSTPVKMWSEQ